MLHERLRYGLQQLVIADPGGGTMSYGSIGCLRPSPGRGGHGRHGTTTAAPPRTHSIAIEYAEHFSRLLDLLELEVAELRGTAPRPERVMSTGGKSNISSTRKRRIVTSELYRGKPDAFVAYVEGCSADLVRKARGGRGLDSHGLPKAHALTSREVPA